MMCGVVCISVGYGVWCSVGYGVLCAGSQPVV